MDYIKTFLDKGTEIMGIDLSAMVGTVSEIVSKTRKAYGGCDRCYGKGYSTTFSGVSKQLRACGCERGKQLLEVFEPKR